MKPEITILNDNEFDYPDDLDDVIATTLTFTEHNINVSININFVNEQEIISINNQFRGYPEPTDVLSFEADVIDPETGKTILGDIIICLPFVEKQAALLENDLNNEIKLMVIHGMLHLLGFEHDDEKSKSLMWDKQKNILESLKIHLNKIPE